MKRIYLAIGLVAGSLGLAATAGAQLGMNLFQKPAIAKFFNPVVGKGAQYESTTTGSGSPSAHTMEMAVVGKESVEGKEGFWMQMSMTTNKGESMLAKALFSRDDFQFHKMIIQMKGQPAMEMPFNPGTSGMKSAQESMADWHMLGTETVTVPAGTFTCEHWRNDKSGSDLWGSEKISPFGMVKEVGKSQTMTLTKLLTDVPDRITGPVTKFDPQMMMQQMQQQGQQKP